MNVVVRADKVESTAQPADPLDHLADKLFHKMGTDGVYARTELYEHVVERLAALITAASRGGHGSDALSAGHEPRAAGEIRLL